MDCKQNWSLFVGKGANMNIEDLGLEEYRHPITKIKLSFYHGKWYVEYRRKPKYFFDRWWWFNDSVHTSYVDAQLRANNLASDGTVLELKHKAVKIEIENNSEKVEIEEQVKSE